MDAHEAITYILSGQTIDEVRRRCNLVVDEGFEGLATHLNENSEFVLTENRQTIIEGVTTGLREKASPGVILHGSYGSGKTVLMRNIQQLCDGPQTIGASNQEFPQITYSDNNIDCTTISIERKDTPFELLSAIFSSLLELPNSPPESAYIRAYENQRDRLAISNLEERLTDEQWERISSSHDNPQSVGDIATVAKELPVGEAFAVTAWLSAVYRDETNRYPGIYLDEFEQAFRSGISTRKQDRLRLLVQKFLRKAVTGFQEFDHPPFILFANTLTLDDLRETLDIERDFIDRVQESISYSIDPSVSESQELLEELYRFYALPVLAGAGEPYDLWYDRLSTAERGDPYYAYPFSDEALSKLLEPLQKTDDGTIIRGFRDFKALFTEYLDRWNPTANEPIELDYLYQHGDDVREALQGNVERVDLERIPGRGSIESNIRDDFTGLDDRLVRVIEEIAREGVLSRENEPAYFSHDQIKACGAKAEIDVNDDDISTLVDTVTKVDYFEAADGNLALYRDQLLELAAPEEGASNIELIRELDQKLGTGNTTLRGRLLLDCLEEYYRDHEESVPSFTVEDAYIKFGIKNELNYTGEVYLCIDTIPEAIEAVDVGEALSFVVCFRDNPDGTYPVKFTVTERGGRAGDLTNNIETHLNQNLVQQLLDDDDRSDYFENIQAAFQGARLADAYKFALKVTLLRDQHEEDIHPNLKRMTFPNQVFTPGKMDSQLTGVYDRYSLPFLGFTGDAYAGKELLTLAYAIEYLGTEGTMEYDEPNHPSISIPGFNRVIRSKAVGLDLQQTLDEFEEKELFIEDRDLKEQYSQQMETHIERISEAVGKTDTDGLDLDDVFELLFGTTAIDAVAKAQLYLLLKIGDYNGHWVLEPNNRIVSVEDSIEARRETVESILYNSVKVLLLEAAIGNQHEEIDVHSVIDAYRTVETATASELDAFESDYTVAKDDLEYDDLDTRMSDLASDKVIGQTEIGPYLTALRPLGEMDSGLLYLIYPRLQHLVTQIESAEPVIKKQATLNGLCETYETLSGESLPVETVTPEPVSAVEDFYSDRTADQLDVEKDINQIVDEVLANESVLSDSITILEKEIESHVPDVEEYDSDDNLQTLENEIKTATKSVNEEIERWRRNAQAAEDTLEDLVRRTDSTDGWDRQAEMHLESLKEELEKPATEIEADTVKNRWNRWKDAKEQLEALSLGSSDIQQLLDEFGLEEDVDAVMSASSIEIPEELATIPVSNFKSLIAALEPNDKQSMSDDDAFEEDSVRRIKLSLLRARVLATQNRQGGEDE